MLRFEWHKRAHKRQKRDCVCVCVRGTGRKREKNDERNEVPSAPIHEHKKESGNQERRSEGRVAEKERMHHSAGKRGGSRYHFPKMLKRSRQPFLARSCSKGVL